MSLLWRLFVGNAVVVVVAIVVLAVTPATVSSPVRDTELAVLAAGVVALLAVDLLVLRRALGPLRRLAAFVETIDPLAPGARADPGDADEEVRRLATALNATLDRVERERRESARRALAAQEDERLRIARELHDEVGQLLTGVVLTLEDVRRRTAPDVAPAVAAAQDEVRRGAAEVRAIAARLRPEALDDLGLPSALAALTNGVRRTAGIEVARQVDPGLPPLAPDVELVLYRVAQEALTNAVRHAAPSRVVVELRAAGDGEVVLRVRDDGHGLRPGASEGTGLLGMRERALLVGGRLEIGPAPGGGTEVLLTVGAEEAAA